MMRTRLIATSALLLVASSAFAQDKNYPKAKVSFDDFKGLVAEVEAHRAKRLIDLDTFLAMSKQPGAVILDTRSTFRFERIHLKGAKHLSFSDFTQDNLRKVIPAFESTVLIYCNNNFEGNQTDFASKVAMPLAKTRVTPATQFAAQAKPLMMALNIPTYVNLYGYGYRNIYELHELVNVNDKRVVFEGSIVEQPQKTVRGVLQHFPSDVRTVQAWHGHNFLVGKTPVLPTDAVPEQVLKKHVGKHVVVTGVWYSGQPWKPTEKEMTLQMPVDPGKAPVIRGEGLKASSITLVER